MTKGIILRQLTAADLPFVKTVYDWYIVNSTATFHTEPVSVEELKTFIYIDHPRFKSFLILSDGRPVGYCYLTHYKPRQAYNKTAELTIYLLQDAVAAGAGKAALKLLETEAAHHGFRNLLAIISGDNERSIRFFSNNGYTQCAHFRKVGEKFGKVLDVVGYQKEME